MFLNLIWVPNHYRTILMQILHISKACKYTASARFFSRFGNVGRGLVEINLDIYWFFLFLFTSVFFILVIIITLFLIIE
jgi:hypothetical protein